MVIGGCDSLSGREKNMDGEKEKTILYTFDNEENNVFDWSYVDYVSIKAKDGKMKREMYLLDGHPLYDTYITREDKKLVAFARTLGCYGNSEKMFDEYFSMDRFYIRTNIISKEQEECIIEYLCQKRRLTNHQQQLLKIMENLESVIDDKKDYNPLYYCGFAKKNDAKEYDQIRFYYKTFSADEKIRFDEECIQYLESFSDFQNDAMFNVVKELVYSKKTGIRCIGIEFGDNDLIKIKYYLCESERGKSLNEVLSELSHFSQLHKSGMSLLNKQEELRNVKLAMIQISNGKNEDANINLYIEPLHRKTRKYYCLREGLVLRNIGDVWFLIDIYEKFYYEKKNLFTLNDIGKIIVEFLIENKVCTIDGMVSYIKSQIKNAVPELNAVIHDDCNEFAVMLLSKGFLKEAM